MRRIVHIISAGCAVVFCLGLSAVWASEQRTSVVKKVQPAVVTVVTYDIDGKATGIGSGFFIDSRGYLITNYHVLRGAYAADVKTIDGHRWPIAEVLSFNESADLIQVSVKLPDSKVPYVTVSDRMPIIAEEIVVVGSPMGLDQTVSEGIISAIRSMPAIGSFFQMSAPISPGSSGSPVVSMNGQVIGVATFQASVGQNLNFAVSGRSVAEMQALSPPLSLSEWTYTRSQDKPRLAADLCRKGFEFSVQGENKKALDYYRQAVRKDPSDPLAWSGLGYCYAGLEQHEAAVDAYRNAIRSNPDNALAHYTLANYYQEIGRDDLALESYQTVVRLSPRFGQAFFRLGLSHARQGQLREGKHAFQKAVEIEPEFAAAHYYLGVTSSKMGNHEAALSALREVIRIEPDSARAHYAMGTVYGQLGRFEDEFEAYRQAIRTDPDYAPAHFKIGQRYFLNGDRAAALAEYKILRDLDPELANHLFDVIYR